MNAIIGPVIEQLGPLVEDAESQRTPRARADRMLTGYVGLAVANRDLFPVFSGDPSVVEFLRSRPTWAAKVRRQIELLAGAQAGASGEVRAAMVMSGVSAAVGVPFSGLDDDSLRVELITAGRRTLGLRAPHGRAATA